MSQNLKIIFLIIFLGLLLFSSAGLQFSTKLENITARMQQQAFAQLVNDMDNDGIEDDMDPCPDNSDTQCIRSESPDQLPGVNAPLDQLRDERSPEVNCHPSLKSLRRRKSVIIQ